jgi:hypothetical protein
MFLHLLTTPREASVPGLIEATPINLMDDLDWGARSGDSTEALISGLQRTKNALDELSSTKRSDGTPWVIYNERERLVLLPRAIYHNLPANPNVVRHWKKTLKEYPCQPLKMQWITVAVEAIRENFGANSSRFKLISEIFEANKKAFHKPGRNSLENGSANHYPNHGENTNTSTITNTITNSNRSLSSNRSPSVRNQEAKEGVSGADERLPKSTMEKSSRDTNENNAKEKQSRKANETIDVPRDFSPRQRAFLHAILCSRFIVRGRGPIPGGHAISNPVELARSLGSENAYPAVDAGAVERAASWTLANPKKAKKDIARFVTNWVAREQERGGTRSLTAGKYPPNSDHAVPFGSNLEQKVRKK